MSDKPFTIDRPAGDSAAPSWEGFLRALLEILEQHLDPLERSVLLRAIGARLAATLPVPPQDTLEGLETRMNERLASTRWGTVSIELDANGPALVLTHARAPNVPITGAEGNPLSPVLEGLHAAWIASQPGAEPDLAPVLVSANGSEVVLRYGA
ncbi:cellulose biosynthesis protein BcsD [Roseomonas sp. CCTCC AB2023176]|uniref:cellulose biosynthesis protein BcsD n=1 Tax=Roseomonas sp. CCTCC AB2023176 TaxID=3342640 RepID=UPI0035DDB33C